MSAHRDSTSRSWARPAQSAGRSALSGGPPTRARARTIAALLGLLLTLLLTGCGESLDPTPTSTGSVTTASEVTSSAAQAPGSPLRIPLPTDELLGRRLADAEAELTELIADACGGDQCIGLRIEPRGSIDPGGRSGCETFVVSVPGTVAEGAEQAIPVLYVPRGGTITLVVEMSCDEGPPSSPSSTEPTPTPQETATTSSGGSPSPTSTSGP